MRLPIGQRLFLGFLILFFLEIGIVGTGIFNINRISRLNNRLSQMNNRLSQMNQQNISLSASMEGVYELLLGFEEVVMPINDYIIHGNVVEKDLYKIEAAELKNRIVKVKSIFSSEGRPDFIKVADDCLSRVEKTAEEIFKIEYPVGNMQAAMMMEDVDASTEKAIEVLNSYHEEYIDKHLEDTEEERDILKKEVDILNEQSAKIAAESEFLFYAFSFLGIILSVVLAYLLSRHIIHPISSLKEACARISKGSRKERIEMHTRDEFEELAQAFNQMIDDLNLNEQAIKKANEELAKWSRLLEQRVEERTKELKNAQVQILQSVKMAAVGQLAGSVAHEINNPLTGVLNNVQLIKMEVAKKEKHSAAEFKEILDIVENSALRCKHIVQSLLDFSRAGRRPYKPVDANDALEKTFILAEHDIKLQNIKILREFSTRMPKVLADASQLQQVFLDIFNNAKWALKPKKEGAELKVKTFLSQDSRSVIIEISDNGCGIEKENLEHIFEPFFTTKEAGEGIGLGLSICYGIIKEHNGLITAESEGKDKGAVFRISLPVIGYAGEVK